MHTTFMPLKVIFYYKIFNYFESRKWTISFYNDYVI